MLTFPDTFSFVVLIMTDRPRVHVSTWPLTVETRWYLQQSIENLVLTTITLHALLSSPFPCSSLLVYVLLFAFPCIRCSRLCVLLFFVRAPLLALIGGGRCLPSPVFPQNAGAEAVGNRCDCAQQSMAQTADNFDGASDWGSFYSRFLTVTRPQHSSSRFKAVQITCN